MRNKVLHAAAALLTTVVLVAVPRPDTADAAPPAGVVGSGADSRSVERLYRAYFLRPADPDGKAYWEAQVAAGTPLTTVSEQFARSTEFRSRYGSLDNNAFVRLVYDNVLGRSPDPTGLTHWQQQLASGQTRGWVMLGFSDSEEFKRRTDLVGSGTDSRSVERLYWSYFLRSPDPTGLAHWQQRVAAGTPLTTVSDAFSQSQEFRTRYGSVSNKQFATLLYLNVLGRAADATGLRHWTAALDAGTPRGSVTLGFSDSEEFKRKAGQPVQNPYSAPSPPGAPAAPGGTFEFFALGAAGAPVQWQPCSPVKVVVNYDGAPPGAADALRSALSSISTATRTPWVLEGTTTEATPSPSHRRPYRDTARYGDRWAPVLVSWAQTWPSGDGAIGYGASGSATGTDGTRRIVTGAVTLRRGWRPPSQANLTALMLHELGHVANLAHAPAKGQVMYFQVWDAWDYRDGDKAGLSRVGSWGVDCSRQPAAPAGDEVFDGWAVHPEAPHVEQHQLAG